MEENNNQSKPTNLKELIKDYNLINDFLGYLNKEKDSNEKILNEDNE